MAEAAATPEIVIADIIMSLDNVLAVAAAAISAIHANDAMTVTVICTVGLGALLSGHFWRLGRVDQPLVLCLLVSWAATLVLLSL